ncbi:MAG: elongator complex protein 3 [Bacillota bacterium]|jgi:histone acetyltransferase (RNA polymerase elongator complex component)
MLRINNSKMLKKAKNTILPFFIPMQGCPHQCIYCDQTAISGYKQGPDQADIAEAVARCDHDIPELAFYGGSFSALPKQKQEQYLSFAQPYLADGRIKSIRISTRPDYIDEQELDFLAAYGVNTIELGIQSFSDQVLRASGRGYDSDTAKRAAHLILEKGFILGLQLMTGLPQDDIKQSLFSAREAVKIRPAMVRIYPTLVLRHTPLALLYENGQYRPQTVEEAVRVCRDMAAIFALADIPVIRIGINPSADVEAALLEGPYDAAFGHLVRSALKKQQLITAITLAGFWPQDIYIPKRQLPESIGHHKSNKLWLQEKSGQRPRFHADDKLSENAIAIAKDSQKFVLSYKEFLQIYEKTMP